MNIYGHMFKDSDAKAALVIGAAFGQTLTK